MVKTWLSEKRVTVKPNVEGALEQYNQKLIALQLNDFLLTILRLSWDMFLTDQHGRKLEKGSFLGIIYKTGINEISDIKGNGWTFDRV